MNVSKLVKAALAVTVSALVFGAVSSQAHSRRKAAADAGTAAPSAAAPTGADAGMAASAAAKTIELKVTEKGYEPSPIKLKKGEPVKLVVTRTTERTCATEVVLEQYNLNVPLPLNKPVEIAFTPKESGTLKYGCHMGKMISGVFIVE